MPSRARGNAKQPMHPPPPNTNLEVSAQVDKGASQSGGNSTILAEEALVPLGNVPRYLLPSQNSGDTSTSLSREICASSSSQIESACLDVEREKFQSLGCSSNVISTLLKARKPSTNYV